MDLRKVIAEWDACIRAGAGRSIVERIEALDFQAIPEARRPEIAALARRLGLYKTGLGLLRNDYLKYRDQPDREELLSEYAALLTEIGATRISERILTSIREPKRASTYFYRALLWIKMWEHERAVLDLDLFIAQNGDSYWQRIADLNRLAALIFLHRFDEAREVQLRLEAAESELSQMARGILSELNGQLLFFSGDRKRARDHFIKSYDALAQAHNPSLLFAEKWVVICDLLNQPWPAVESRFRDIQSRARNQGYWEILRELDRFFALKENDQEILGKLYFGTPFSGYKRMINRDLKWNPPPEFYYSLGPSTSRTNILDLGTLELKLSGQVVGGLPKVALRLLAALSVDLYRPMAVGSLFERVYSGEYFDPSFANQRIYQAISRFRKLAEQNGIPLRIDAVDLGFVVGSDNSDFALRYETQVEVASDLASGELTKLRAAFGERDFTAADFALVQGLSKRTVHRRLADHVAAGEISKYGVGSRTRYRLKTAA